MHYKNRNDFRIETAMNMMDRYDVTKGSIENKNLKIISDLPEELLDEERLKEKLLNDNKKLYSVVQYFKQRECRRRFISSYFGFSSDKCSNCDNCGETEIVS
jgi:ATP-dependent DNA helicase RecQ